MACHPASQPLVADTHCWRTVLPQSGSVHASLWPDTTLGPHDRTPATCPCTGQLHHSSAELQRPWLCRDQAPWQARAHTFPAVVEVLGQCLATRYTAFAQDLWRTAVGAFNTIVSTGLPAVNIAALDGVDTRPCWQALALAFHAFLLGDSALGEDAGPPLWGAGAIPETAA